MNKNFSDEQLDQILRQIVKETVSDENEIAESPYLWQKIQRNIEAEKSRRRRGWIPPWFDWRMAGFAAAALVVCFGLIWFANGRGGEIIADANASGVSVSETPKIDESEIAQTDEKEEITETKSTPKTSPKKVISSKNTENLTASTKSVKRPIQKPQLAKIQPKAEEIKTDFIALNYSPAAESGQIMKVKVPRSMMVTLGVTQRVENGSELVNAEVLVGDDGLARAIRFVQ